MEHKKIAEGVYSIGAVDWDRRLFDGLIPIPDGTSYNAYLVKGTEKTALLDTVDPSKADVLMAHLDGVERIDYIVSHHAEQDHSGAMPQVLARYPQARVVASPKGKDLLKDHLGVSDDRITTVSDGQTLELGGKTLEFIHTPWVHWPETMVSYLKEDRILFSCDMFGSHLATSRLYIEEHWKVCEAAKRYYAEVMMPFRGVIKKHIEKLEKYPLAVIAPSHGPAHMETACIMESHKDWVSDRLSNTAVLPYVSMHGSTEAMANRLTEELSSRGVEVQKFNLPYTDTGKLAMALVDAATIVVGSPTVLTGAHPAAVSAAFLVNALKPKLRFSSIIGSYAWGGKMVEQISGLLSGLKTEAIEPVMAKGSPKEADLGLLAGLAEIIASKHRENGILS